MQVKQSTEPSTGIGLRNIMKRYELVSDREVGIMKKRIGLYRHTPVDQSKLNLIHERTDHRR